jgi:hypothetical protein
MPRYLTGKPSEILPLRRGGRDRQNRYMTTEKRNYKQMKSSMTQSDTQRDDYQTCEDSM